MFMLLDPEPRPGNRELPVRLFESGAALTGISLRLDLSLPASVCLPHRLQLTRVHGVAS